MKLFSFLALAITTVITCSIGNPMQVQAAEFTPQAVVTEFTDPTAHFEDTLFILINEERERHGLHAYELDNCVDAASEIRVTELETYFSHNRNGGKRFSSVLAEAGISYSASAEILAFGHTNPKQVFDAWLNSPEHCSRILSDNFTNIGVAHNRTNTGIDYWEILFVTEK